MKLLKHLTLNKLYIKVLLYEFSLYDGLITLNKIYFYRFKAIIL